MGSNKPLSFKNKIKYFVLKLEKSTKFIQLRRVSVANVVLASLVRLESWRLLGLVEKSKKINRFSGLKKSTSFTRNYRNVPYQERENYSICYFYSIQLNTGRRREKRNHFHGKCAFINLLPILRVQHSIKKVTHNHDKLIKQ